RLRLRHRQGGTGTHEQERIRSGQKRNPPTYSRAAETSNHADGSADESDMRQRAARRSRASHPGPQAWFGSQVSRWRSCWCQGVVGRAADDRERLSHGTMSRKSAATSRMGSHPRCDRMTAPRYSAPNNAEIPATRPTAPIGPDASASDGIPRMISAAAQPASADARTYFQTAPMIATIPRRIGLPAYQRAGTVRAQKETTQATAIPVGPQRRPLRKSRPVTANSTIPQRNHRSALPMERWIQ